MSGDKFDVTIAEWISEGPDRGPRHALDRALAASRRVEQRPVWVFPRRLLPAGVTYPGLQLPRLAGIGLLILLLLLTLVAFAVVIGGAPPRIRSPFGLAEERLVAFQDGTSIAVARIDGSGRRTITGELPYARSPSFSPDGTRLAFVAPRTAAALGGPLFLVRVDGAGPAVRLSRSVDVVAANVTSIAWSPDTKLLAFAGDVGGVARIFVAATDGSSLVSITDRSVSSDLPTWSPDGTWISFREQDPDGVRTRLRMTRPDGTEVQEITLVIAPDAFVSKVRWASADGPLSYSYNPGFGSKTSAYIDLGFQHNNQPWTDGTGGFVDYGIPWSPDGKLLAVLTASSGVILADSDTTAPYNGQLRPLGHVADCWVDWAPDGTGLYGGAPGDCNGTVFIPLADPAAIYRLPGVATGPASWQPLAP